MSLPNHFYQLAPDARIFFVKEESASRRLQEDLRLGANEILEQIPLNIHSKTFLDAIQRRIDLGISLNTYGNRHESYHPIKDHGGDYLSTLLEQQIMNNVISSQQGISPDKIQDVHDKATVLAGKMIAQYLRGAGLEDRAKPIESYFSNLALFGRN